MTRLAGESSGVPTIYQKYVTLSLTFPFKTVKSSSVLVLGPMGQFQITQVYPSCTGILAELPTIKVT